MKEVMFFFALIFVISCTYREGEIVEDVRDGHLDAYLSEFEFQAQLRGFSIDLNLLDLETIIAPIDDNGVAGTCHYSSRYPNRITIDENFWNSASELMREMVVFHELGHCVLGRSHREDFSTEGYCLSIMQSGQGDCQLLYNANNREFYLNELFLPGEY